MNDPIIQRLKGKSRGNQIAIAVGSSLSEEIFSIPRLAESIISHCNLDFKVQKLPQHFEKWNELIEQAEEKKSRDYLVNFVKEKVSIAKPRLIHYKVASLPISNFIDATFDRSLYKALVELGKKPTIHDWNNQAIGRWEQTHPNQPNVFFSFCNLAQPHPWYGIYEPSSRNRQNQIHLMNTAQMLENKDLLLTGFTSFEAESVLHLLSLIGSCNKVINCLSDIDNPTYWCQRGVYITDIEIDQIIDYLLPSEASQYTGWDIPIGRKLMDITRDKQYDCFLSHFGGDKPFAKRLAQDLELRGLHIWVDENEIDVGDSLSDTIQSGLSNSYSFAIILSEESLSRPWVQDELRAAYALRRKGDFKILPILYKECEIPLFLSDYAYADFRIDNQYDKGVPSLERSIRNAMLRARNKK